MTTKKELEQEPNNTSQERDLSELTDEKNKIDPNSPLAIIREKEVELRKQLIKSQTKADKIIEDVKKEAEKLIEKIIADGEIKAEEHFKRELAKIEKRAKDVRSQAPAKAKAVADEGFKNLDKALDQLRSFITPKSS